MTHFIEHMLFKGTDRYSALRDRGDLRRPRRRAERRHLARAHARLRARAGPPRRDGARRDGRHGLLAGFAELDTEREVVLEEIAMYEDTPQELVHDLIAEAVFGDDPLGRPVIGTARGDLVDHRATRSRATTGSMYVAGRTSSSRRPGTSSTTQLVELVERGARARGTPRAPARRTLRPPLVAAAAAEPALPAEGDRAVPRLPRRARHLALRPPPLRRLDPRRDPRRLGLVAPLPGDPREARHGLPVYSFVSQYTDTGQIGVYLGTREDNLDDASRSSPSRSPTSPPATCRRASSSARRRTSRGASCSRWSPRRPG